MLSSVVSRYTKRASAGLAVYAALVLMVVAPAAVDTVHAVEEPLDQIAAVVGREIILVSEINQFISLQLMQSGQDPTQFTEEQLTEMQCNALQTMIDDRILVEKARFDSIVVDQQTVEDAVREQIAQIRSRFADEAAFQQQLATEGTTERLLRENFRNQMQRYFLREELRRSLAQNITVGFHEVEQFYAEHQDSLPEVPPSVSLVHITRVTRAGDSSLAIAGQRIAQAQARLAAGEDFAAVAGDLSEDRGTAVNGGDVGYFSRGMMFPEFESAAFTLDSGQTSDAVQTEIGLHLIQNMGFRGDEVRARHILAFARPSDEDRVATRDTMRSVYERLRAGANFGEMAREYSMEPNVRQTGGRIGPISPEQLPAWLGRVVATLEIGQIGEPFESENGTYHIIKLLTRTRAHRVNLTDDRRQIEEYVRSQKLYDEIVELLERERERMYVDVRLEQCGHIMHGSSMDPR